MSDAFAIKTEKFEGPIELLLHLVESRKLPIHDISLAEVTEDYITYVKSQEMLPYHELTHFMVVAATLLLIKSKSLLPMLSLTEEEEGDINDLKRRMLLYQKIQEASMFVKVLFGKQPLFTREEGKQEMSPVFAPDANIKVDALVSYMESVLIALPKKEKLPEAQVRKVIHIEEVIRSLMDRVQEGIQVSFQKWTTHTDGNPQETKEKKVYVIVSFLAVLELVRKGILDCIQDAHFGDISITKRNETV